MGYDVILAPLIKRMTNLEELSLCFVNECQIVDGDNLEENIINHMSKLNKFTFNIGSLVRFVDENNIPSNEDIKKTFENFNNIIISNIDYFPKKNLFYYHIYSYPYTWNIYYYITNNFSGGLFKSVREISLFDEHPFEHDFFLRITQSFPFVNKINIHNYEAQENNHHEQRIINYHHLINIDLAEAHEDYLDEYLNEKKTCLLNNIHLRVHYDRLKKVTNNFTRDAIPINCSKIIRLLLRNCTMELSKLKDYFPHAKIN